MAGIYSHATLKAVWLVHSIAGIYSHATLKAVWLVSFSGIYAYTTLKEGAEFVPDDLRADLRAIVKEKIGSFAVPEVIQVRLFNSGLAKIILLKHWTSARILLAFV